MCDSNVRYVELKHTHTHTPAMILVGPVPEIEYPNRSLRDFPLGGNLTWTPKQCFMIVSCWISSLFQPPNGYQELTYFSHLTALLDLIRKRMVSSGAAMSLVFNHKLIVECWPLVSNYSDPILFTKLILKWPTATGNLPTIKTVWTLISSL